MFEIPAASLPTAVIHDTVIHALPLPAISWPNSDVRWYQARTQRIIRRCNWSKSKTTSRKMLLRKSEITGLNMRFFTAFCRGGEGEEDQWKREVSPRRVAVRACISKLPAYTHGAHLLQLLKSSWYFPHCLKSSTEDSWNEIAYLPLSTPFTTRTMNI